MKLPKDLVADPRHDEVLRILTENVQPLWTNGQHPVATLPVTDALLQELRRDLSLGHACQGIEQISRTLEQEQRGLDALKQKSPEKAQASRISRFLFMANDGSERFYRECDSLLYHYSDRLFGCRLDINGEALGEALRGEARMVRAVLVIDKKACARALLALVPKAK